VNDKKLVTALHYNKTANWQQN